MSKEKALQLDEVMGKTITPTPCKIGLHNAHAIRRELSSVYRDMRNRTIEAQDGTRLAYVLDMLRKSYETSVLEDRLNELERILKTRTK